MKPVEREIRDHLNGISDCISVGAQLLKRAQNYVELSAVGGDREAEELNEAIGEYLYLEGDDDGD